MRTVHNLKEVAAKRRNLRNTLTPQEILLWSRLKGKALGCKFRRQHSIGKYIVDFCCPERKLIVELDGSQHGEESAERYDRLRTEYLQKLGYSVLRFWNNEVNGNLEGVLDRILEELNHTTPSPSSQRNTPPPPPSGTPPQLRRREEGI